MGYRKIQNLYHQDIARTILSLGRCYALEKIHGTSAHIGILDGKLKIFAGGIKHEDFIDFLDKKHSLEKLESKLRVMCDVYDTKDIILYGEAYGGKCQRMQGVYGPLNFVTFEVKLIKELEIWLTVPKAHIFSSVCGLPFVYYELGPSTVEWLDSQRDRPSMQAWRNGLGIKYGEGIVVRPLDESTRDRFGNRILAKHKRPEFRETKSVRKINPDKAIRWADATKVADEFVVPERLNHILGYFAASGSPKTNISHTGDVIKEMTRDIKTEEGHTIDWTQEVVKAIGSRTAKLFHNYLRNKL